MADNEDDINEFSPDENSSGIEEFNPYESFLQNDNNEQSLENNAENNVTTEEDIIMPEFLNGEESSSIPDVNEFSQAVATQPVRKEETESANFSSYESSYDNHKNSEIENSVSSKSNKQTEPNEFVPTENTQPKDNENSNIGGDTFDETEDPKFKPKVSAKDADQSHGSKPHVLNKKLLLTIIICVLGGIMLFTFLMPAKKSKSQKNAKPVAETHASRDYASIANRHTLPVEQDAQESGHYENTKEEPKTEDVEIPPIIPEQKSAYNPNVKYTTTTSTNTVEIPDTRNDALHGKQIAGIKGLSSTQQSYSTDYQQTLAKNTASTSANSSYSLPSKDEYMKNVLSAYTSAYGNATAGNNAYNTQNDQSGKNSFFNNGRQGENVGQGEWLNLNTLWQGTIFEAVLTSELNTDLPGEITARIAKNIYSSQDGRYLLIPQNSVLYGTYNSSISYSQSRVQVGWHTLIRPDGYQIQLGNMNATDAKGASGLAGIINDHPLAYLKAIGLMSVFSIVNSEFNNSLANTQNEYVQNLLANSQNVTMELADKLIERAMNVQPTIKIKSGTKINIVVNQNLSLPPVENIPVTQPYHRYK